MVSENPIDGRCNYEYSLSDDYKHDSGYCESSPMDNGRCYHHGGKNHNGGAPEANENSKSHGAFSKHFVSDLTKAETEAFEDAKTRLENPESAQQVAREVAAELLLKYKRSGDDRFITRFENVCDKFGIAPEDELNVNHSGIEDMWPGELERGTQE